MKKIIPFLFVVAMFFCSNISTQAQVAINSDGGPPHASAMLDVESTSKGLLIPRITTAQRIILAGSAIGGLLVFDIDTDLFYIHNGTSWTEISTGGLWSRNGSTTYLSNSGDYVGIGTSTPSTPFQINSGTNHIVRLYSTSGGAGIEYVSQSSDDWYVGTWGGSLRVVYSDDNFSTQTDQYYFSTSKFEPWANDSKTLGSSSKRWKSFYSIDGDFSGDVGIGTTAPDRKLEVYGDWRTARLTSASGAFLEFVGTNYTTGWAVGNYAGTMRILSSDDDFSSSDDEYWFSETAFNSFYDGDKTLGITNKRWSNTYSDDVTVSNSIYLNSNLEFHSLNNGLRLHNDDQELATVYITPTTTASGDSSSLYFAEDDLASYGMYWLYDGNGNELELWGNSGATNYGPHMLIERNDGDIAIGTTTFATGYKLSVDGDIICEKVRVMSSGSWPDYVFNDTYELLPISSLSEFIQKNKHLPGIPSAAEIEKDGIDLGENQKHMMKKIEELTLYIIEQQEEIEVLKEQISKIKNNE